MTNFVSKDFGREGLDGRPVFPCVQRQSCFTAGLFEKSKAVPSVLDWDLGQQQTATAVRTNKKTVASDFDFVSLNGLRRGENAQLNFEKRRLVCSDGRETVIVKGGGPRGFRYGAIDRANRQHIADASPQFTVQVERCESPTSFGKVRRGWIQTNLSMLKL